MYYTWTQTNFSVTIHVLNSDPDSEVYVSSCFVRITDPKQKEVIAIDLAQNVLFKGRLAPVVKRNPKEISIILMKESSGFWDSIAIKAGSSDKSSRDKRRAESMQDANRYYSNTEAEELSCRGSLTSLARQKMLAEHHKRIGAIEEQKQLYVASVKEDARKVLTNPFDSASIYTSESDIPVRETRGIIMISLSSSSVNLAAA
jgi:hypothetical protein